MKFKLLTVSLLLTGLCPLTAKAVILPILADTHITTSNAGASVAVNINPATKGLLSFNMSALPAGITSSSIAKATLVFYVKTLPTNGRLQVSPITKSWAENTVTTRTAPLEGLPLSTSAAIGGFNKYFAVDVTHLVMSWVDVPTTNFGLALEPLVTTFTSLTIDSKESTLTSHPAYIDVVLKGPVGLTGAQGIRGVAGTNGAPGPIGLTGSTGAQGIRGLTGAAGANGVQGIQGPRGAIGPQGSAGATGPAGPTSSFIYSNTCGSSGSDPCKVGTVGPGGGWIYFVDYNDQYPGFTYLEAAPTDIEAVIWCDNINLNLGLDGWANKGVGKGRGNTMAMLKVCASGAAQSTNAYTTATTATTVVGDWFLPSLGELKLMYDNLLEAGVGGFANSIYWNSTEFDNSYTWYQDFTFGTQDSLTKDNLLTVRAVRTF